MYQQLWGYKVEEKLCLGVREQKRLNTTAIDNHWGSDGYSDNALPLTWPHSSLYLSLRIDLQPTVTSLEKIFKYVKYFPFWSEALHKASAPPAPRG
jgi:hypothetical protein